jgi:mRNA interferase MazF
MADMIRTNAYSGIEYVYGDVLLVDFGKGVGSEQRGKRPAIVLEQYNKNQNMLFVCPLTRATANRVMSIHVEIPGGNKQFGGLAFESVALPEQVRTIDKHRVLKIIGHIDDCTLLNRIWQALLYTNRQTEKSIFKKTKAFG